MLSLAFALQTILAAYLVLGEPFYGKYTYKAMQARAKTDPGARSRFYWLIVAMEWGLVALAVLSLGLGGVPLSLVGFRPPVGLLQPIVWIPTVGLFAGLAAGLVAPALSSRARDGIRREMERSSDMLPVTPPQQGQFAVVSVTAGVCEEILYRGFIIYYLGLLLPAVPAWGLGVLSAVVFGFAHLYQGWGGVLGTGVVGALMALLYLATGSLYPGMVLHALMDLRAILLVRIVRRGEV